MNQNVYNIKNIAGKYYLYFGDEQVMTSEGAEIFTTSEELANLLLNDAVEYGADTENVLSILSYHSLYCDLLQQEEDTDGENIEMLNNLIHVDYFWAFDEPRQIRAAALSQYLDSLPKYINDLPLHQHAAYINLMAATGSILLPHKIVSNLLSEDSQYSPNDFDGFIETLESYGKETGASENIDVDWTFDSIKKMVKTFITYYTLEKV
jgi:hypothetical protein